MLEFEATLDDFRWRKTQRRLVAKKSLLRSYYIIDIVGKNNKVRFVFDSYGPDPFTKNSTSSRIYKPHEDTPESLKDIVLYVHI